MLAFVNAVLRQNLTIEGTAQYRFGKLWTTLNTECATYIRTIAR